LWLPIRKRIITKGDIVRMIQSNEAVRAARHEAVMHELTRNNGGSMRDAVDRMELALHVNVATVRQALDHHEAAMFHADEHGRTIWVNNTYLRWTGRQLRDVVGYGWMTSVSESMRDEVREEWDDVVREQREFSMHYAMIDADGTEFIVDAMARPVMDPKGEKVVRWNGEIRQRRPPPRRT
jgi:PAS domain S-box-containing protein